MANDKEQKKQEPPKPAAAAGVQGEAPPTTVDEAAKDKTGKTAFLTADHPFGLHFNGMLFRFKRGLNPIPNISHVVKDEKQSFVEFLTTDSYVKANGAEVVYK